MESIYWVLCWLCHRTCRHCYDDRFRPYYGSQLDSVVDQARRAFARIVENLPESMTFLEGPGQALQKGRIILAGGEVLLDPVREPVLYPTLDLLRRKYGSGVSLIVQTTGDLVTPRLAAELLEHGVDMISVSGIDSYHAGLESAAAQEALVARLTATFETLGMIRFANQPGFVRLGDSGERYYSFFGAQPDSWIGKLWPRGRAQQHELSTATLADNFCNGWSGGLNFLNGARAGSEVSIEPDGQVYPCCMKTALAIGNVADEPLLTILDRLRGDPVYEAINAGQPQRMGLAHGWSEAKFLERSGAQLPSGRIYQNLCIGCDAFHREVLGGEVPQLVQLTV